MGQAVHSLAGTAPALGHLIDCLHNFLSPETDLTNLLLCLSNTGNMMSPSELDSSGTSVNVGKCIQPDCPLRKLDRVHL